MYKNVQIKNAPVSDISRLLILLLILLLLLLDLSAGTEIMLRNTRQKNTSATNICTFRLIGLPTTYSKETICEPQKGK